MGICVPNAGWDSCLAGWREYSNHPALNNYNKILPTPAFFFGILVPARIFCKLAEQMGMIFNHNERLYTLSCKR